MTNKKNLFGASIIFFVLFLQKTIVFADVGPKASVDVALTYNKKVIPDETFYGQMLSCSSLNAAQSDSKGADTVSQLMIMQFDSKKNCYWHPAPHVFGGSCSQGLCDFSYYPPKDFKLAVYVPSLNTVFISDEIIRKSFSSSYTADLTPDKKITMSEEKGIIAENTVSPTTNSSPSKPSFDESFRDALIVTEALELFAAFIFVFIARVPSKLKTLFFVFLANIISLPIVWYVFPRFTIAPIAIFALSELFAIVFEAYGLYFFLKKTLPMKKAFALSLIINLVSMLNGLKVY